MTPDDAYQWLAEHSRETAYLKSMGQLAGLGPAHPHPPQRA